MDSVSFWSHGSPTPLAPRISDSRNSPPTRFLPRRSTSRTFPRSDLEFQGAMRCGDRRESVVRTRGKVAGGSRIKLRGKRRRGQLCKGIRETLEHCFTNTSFHALRYVVDPELCAIERLLWLVLFAASLVVATKVIYTLALRFQVSHVRRVRNATRRFERAVQSFEDSNDLAD